MMDLCSMTIADLSINILSVIDDLNPPPFITRESLAAAKLSICKSLKFTPNTYQTLVWTLRIWHSDASPPPRRETCFKMRHCSSSFRHRKECCPSMITFIHGPTMQAERNSCRAAPSNLAGMLSGLDRRAMGTKISTCIMPQPWLSSNAGFRSRLIVPGPTFEITLG